MKRQDKRLAVCQTLETKRDNRPQITARLGDSRPRCPSQEKATGAVQRKEGAEMFLITRWHLSPIQTWEDNKVDPVLSTEGETNYEEVMLKLCRGKSCLWWKLCLSFLGGEFYPWFWIMKIIKHSLKDTGSWLPVNRCHWRMCCSLWGNLWTNFWSTFLRDFLALLAS